MWVRESYRDDRERRVGRHRTRWSSETRREAITRTRQVLRQTAAVESHWPGRQPAPLLLLPLLLLLLLKTGTGSRSWPPFGKKAVPSWSKLFWWTVALRSSDQSPDEAGWADCGCAASSTIILGWGWANVVGATVVSGDEMAARFFDSGESLVP